MKPKNPYVAFSIPNRSNGGYHTPKSAKALLKAHGIEDVPSCDTSQEGHFGLEVKRRFRKKANSLLTAMPTEAYLEALQQLGLTISGKATAQALGLSLRQCQRMAAGEVLVPATIEKLLKSYLRHGLDDAA